MPIGRWVPVRLDTASAVLAQVNEFVESFRMLGGSVPHPDMVVITERRLQQMLKSAELRLDVITTFIDANPDANTERLNIAARNLMTMLATEGVAHDRDPAVGRELAEKTSSISPRQGRTPRTPAVGVTFEAAVRRSPSHAASKPAGYLAFLENLGPTNSSLADDVAAATDSLQNPTDDASRLDMYIQQLKTREEALKYKLQFSTEREQEVLQKLLSMETENLRLERALVELSESRERMKGLVEEQVFTGALHTRLMGLLHLEKNRTFDVKLTRGCMFWALSFIVLVYCFVTRFAVLFVFYTEMRTGMLEIAPSWSLFCLDCALVAILMAAAHEWASFAANDLFFGAAHWIVSTLAEGGEEQAALNMETTVPLER